MQNIRSFFNPENLLNPGKIFPQPSRCVESKIGQIPKNRQSLDEPKMIVNKSGISV